MLSCCNITANEHDSLLRHDSFVNARNELIGDHRMLSSLLSGDNDETSCDDDDDANNNGPINLVTGLTDDKSGNILPILDFSLRSPGDSPGSNQGLFFTKVTTAPSDTDDHSDDDDHDEEDDDDDDYGAISIDFEELVLDMESLGNSGKNRSGSISSISTNSGSSFDGSTCSSSICSSFSGSDSSSCKRAEFLSATIYRSSSSTTFGIGLRMSKNLLAEKRVLKVASIDSKGLLANSPIRVGDILYSINDLECRYMDAKTAGEFLRSLPKKQSVTFICQNPSKNADSKLVESMITKQSPGHTTGLGLSRSDDDSSDDEGSDDNKNGGGGGGGGNSGPGVVICSIGPDSLFAPSLLNAGDRILTVNNKSCKNLDTYATADLIRSASRTVSVVTKTRTETASVVAKNSALNVRPKFLCATFKKADKKMFLGVALSVKMDRNNRKCLVISTLNKKGLLGSSPFKVGDTLISINNKKYTNGDTDPKAAMMVLKNLTGFVTLVAKSSDVKNNNTKRDKKKLAGYNSSELVEISFSKPTPDYRVGLVLRRDEKGRIRVCDAVSGGGAANGDNNNWQQQEEEPSLLSVSSSFLRTDDIILSINRVPVEDLDLSIVASLIRNAATHITLVALKDNRKSYSKMR